jgi:hypothetical protein
MKVNQIYAGIFEVENFASEEECKFMTLFAESIPENIWFTGTKNQDYSWWDGKVISSPKSLPDKSIPIFDDIEERVRTLFVNYLEITGLNLNRYMVDDFLNYHTDEWRDEEESFIRYGIIIYWNDDYEGGELHYKDLDVSYKPKAGSLVFHDGNILHGTMPVKSNSIRYSSTMFVKELRGTPISLNKEIFKDINERTIKA